MNTTKEAILAALEAHIAQRSGIDGRDYDSRESFMSDYRRMLRDGRDARRMLQYVRLSGIDAAALRAAFERAFSGRLSLVERADGSVACDYVAGQYFVTEYRAAACAVLARALWTYWHSGGVSDVAKCARHEFGRGIASRWF